MNTDTITLDSIAMLSDKHAIEQEIARLQVMMMQKRHEKNYEVLLDLENLIDKLQRKLIAASKLI